MQDVFQELYNVILDRRENPQEGSYTCYLFEKGTDKILKKVAEESGGHRCFRCDGRACSPPSEIRQPQAVSSGG